MEISVLGSIIENTILFLPLTQLYGIKIIKRDPDLKRPKTTGKLKKKEKKEKEKRKKKTSL